VPTPRGSRTDDSLHDHVLEVAQEFLIGRLRQRVKRDDGYSGEA
jgi:hypothetical protein